MAEPVQDTVVMREEQYRDRWSSFGRNTGITKLSERLDPAQLRQFEILSEFDDEVTHAFGRDDMARTDARAIENDVILEHGGG